MPKATTTRQRAPKVSQETSKKYKNQTSEQDIELMWNGVLRKSGFGYILEATFHNLENHIKNVNTNVKLTINPNAKGNTKEAKGANS